MYEPAIRRLRAFDRPEIETHFRSLDPQSLRLRFGVPMPHSTMRAYTAEIFRDSAIVFGAFPDSHLRGLGELRPMRDTPRAAETALTVELPWQNRGIGDALLSRLIVAARNRGFTQVQMLCLATNQRMRHLACKHRAELRMTTGQISATLTAPHPTPFSVIEELAGEYHALARAILSWPD